MVQGNRGDRQAGCGRRAALPPAPGRLLVRAVRAVPGSCCTTSATARPPTAPRSGHRPRLEADGSHDHRGVFIPPGVAHGFAALTDMTITYLVDGYYNPADELGVAWDDPAVGADWGVTEPILSARDQANPAPRRDLPPALRPRLRPCGPMTCASSSPAAPASSARTTCVTCSRTPTTGHGVRRAHLRRQPRRRSPTSTTIPASAS